MWRYAPVEKKKRYKHTLSEVRADFLDRPWTPLPGARARGSAGGAATRAQRRSKKSARTSESVCL